VNIESKLPRVGTTIFTVMSQLAQECNALNLSQGFPDFDCPAELVNKVSEHMRAGHNQYAPMSGIPELRQAIALKTSALYGATVDADTDITVTSGATDALYTAITAIVRPGDEVIMFDPAYDSYDPAVVLAGGTAVHIDLVPPDYHVDWDRVRASISPRTRMIIVNSPHNPTGAVFRQGDIDNLAGIVDGTEILLLSDEVYEHIIFDGISHQSMLVEPALRERAFVVSSFGKTYHATGWKMAYCIAPERLSVEFRKVHQYVTFCSNAPIQYALAEFMQSSSHHLNLATFYQSKRDHFARGLDESRLKVLPCSGTYFQLVDYKDISDEHDTVMARRLTKEAGIASIPVSVFYETDPGRTVLRFCFAKHEDTLDAATRILRTL
jgi:methionine aminotransferase